MVLATSVFLTQVLCLIVPCDPNYQLPDTRPAVDSGTSVSIVEDTLEQQLLPNLRDVRDLTEKGVSYDVTNDGDCPDEQPYVQTLAGIVQGYRIRVVGGRKICAFEGTADRSSTVSTTGSKIALERSSEGDKVWATMSAAFHNCSEPLEKRIVFSLMCTQISYPIWPQIGSKHCEASSYLYTELSGYFFGSSTTYGPAYFLQRDVVLVTLQYRVGVLGFISTGDSVCPGNQGMKDQTLALKWVHENIIEFGGDPQRVTIMGQSAGSAAVHLHMLSHASRAYFQNAVSLSGTAFNYWSFFDPIESRNFTNAFAKRVGCPTHDSVELFECIKSKNPVDLVAQTPNFLDDWPYPSNVFRPTIEYLDNNPSAFLTDFPENIYRRNEVAKVPWLVTTCSGEGYTFLLFPFLTKQIPTLQRHWDELAVDLVDAENLDIDRGKLLKRLNRFYFKNFPPEKATVHTFAQIVTDRTFLTGIYEAAKAHVQVAPTYSYLFDFNGKYNFIVNYGYPSSEWGVAHTEDAFYLFNATRVYSGFQRGELEYDISRILVNVITNFAAKGVPVYTTDSGEDVEIWLPHADRDNLNFLGVSKYIGMIGDPFRKRMRFWRSLRLPDTPMNVIVEGLDGRRSYGNFV